MGTAFTGGGGAAAITALPAQLPYTGATHLMLMIGIGLILLVAGTLFVGLARRAQDSTALSPS